MPYCPNPDCPHKKRTGRPAEFSKGITLCSDCGSVLVKEVTEKPDTRKFTLSDFQKRVLYTIGLVLFSRVLVLIPAPGIDLEVLARVARASGRELNFSTLYFFSTFALGIMPYLSAYMLVEILSLFIPPLKTWRGEGYSGRTKIKWVFA